jgi:NAD(P)-dependent dehydrogenase (short-subunit alcohol dehydrogenase family)
MDRVTTPFGFSTTAADVASGIELAGRRSVVTGATSGIGVATARALASTGCEVVLAVRDVAAGERMAKDIATATGNTAVRAAALDLADQGSVAAATSVLLAISPLLDGIGGRYFVGCNETETIDKRSGTLHGVARYALEPANAERLWDVSEASLAGASTSAVKGTR